MKLNEQTNAYMSNNKQTNPQFFAYLRVSQFNIKDS